MSGLVIEQSGRLQIKNRIYQEIFSLAWVEQQLTKLRPYSQALQKWVLTSRDPAELLRGQALIQAQIRRQNLVLIALSLIWPVLVCS